MPEGRVRSDPGEGLTKACSNISKLPVPDFVRYLSAPPAPPGRGSTIGCRGIVRSPTLRAGQGIWLHQARRSLADPGELEHVVMAWQLATTLPPQLALPPISSPAWKVGGSIPRNALRSAKEQVGLDQYEVRRWDGWYRHHHVGDAGAGCIWPGDPASGDRTGREGGHYGPD